MTSYLRLQDKLGADAAAVVDVLMVGTGEYTCGFSGGGKNRSDKSSGVVALSVLDMKSRGKVGRAAMCGVNGTKFPAIREHMRSCITEAYPGSGLDASAVETFPADDKVDPHAYKAAVKSFRRGDVAFVFTPDDTHFDIAAECVERGMHVMVTKPIVQTLEQHRKLAEAAARNNVLVAVEVRVVSGS
jgi:D-galacturonate reductase